MTSFLLFSIKNAFRKKGVALLAIFGVALGCALMTFLLSLSEGMNQKIETTFTKLAGSIIVTSENSLMGGGQIMGGSSLLPEKYIGEMEKLNDVKEVFPRVRAFIPKEALETISPVGTPLTGIDEKKEKDSPQEYIIEGRKFEKKEEIIIGKSMKDDLERFDTKIGVGDKIEIPIIDPKTRMPIGKKELKFVGVFETNNMTSDSEIFCSIELARELSGVPENKASSIIVKANSVENVDAIAKNIEKKFEDSDPGVKLIVAKSLLGEANDILDIFTNFLIAISLVAAVAGGISILIIMLISVIERMKEFAILKAVGWNGNNIIFSILVESLVLSLLGSSMGILIGYGGINIARSYISDDIGVVTPELILGVMAFGIFIGIIGGVYPAWRASRVAPMEILRGL